MNIDNEYQKYNNLLAECFKKEGKNITVELNDIPNLLPDMFEQYLEKMISTEIIEDYDILMDKSYNITFTEKSVKDFENILSKL